MENITTMNDPANNDNAFMAMIGGNEGGGGGGGDSGGGGGGSGGVSGGVGIEEVVLKKGPWTTAEDAILIEYVTKHGEGNWNAVQRNTGLARCGKSCRLRWANHLRPNLKKGAFSPEEEKLIVELHAQFGNKWARMAALLPGRTDNEIKNYWNTRVKRRQRQGLPLYSDDPNHPTTPTTPPIPAAGSNHNPSTKFEFFPQNHCLSPNAHHRHSPLSSLLHHRTPSSSPHTFLDPAPVSLSTSSASSPLSFTFQRPTPMLCSSIGFKRLRSCPSFNLHVPPSITPCSSSQFNDSLLTAQYGDLDGFRFPIQLNSSSFPHYSQTPMSDSADRGGGVTSPSPSLLRPKLELPSNQYSQPHQEVEFNDHSMQTSTGMLGEYLMEAHTMASSSQNSRKRSYLTLNEGNNVFDGCQTFDDGSLSSVYWSSSSSSGVKPKEEPADVNNKSLNEDYSTLHNVMPSTTMQGHQGWHNNNNNSNASEVSNVQSSGGIIGDDNFGLDIKPVASLFPLTNTANHNENQTCYSWDNLPGLC